MSSKQKINTKSSTEAELVAIADCIIHVIWIRHFLLAQSFEAASTVTILQDNQSAILLEQNGILSSTKRTKHLNAKFFYIKNKIDAKEVTVTWCPTDKTVSDYLSKPLSGEKFRQFRANIMNLPDSFLVPLKPKMPKEGRYFNFHKSDGKARSETILSMIKVDDKTEEERRNFDLTVALEGGQ